MHSYTPTLLLLPFIFLLAACTPGPKEDSLFLLFTGDVLLDRGVRPIVEREGAAQLFDGVATAFARADAVIINLECPLTDTPSPISKQFIFRADEAWANGLHAAGITHACMANNHTNDQGRQGLQTTAQALRDAGIVPIGYGTTVAARQQPVLIHKGTLTAAVFNAVTFPLENWVPADSLPDVNQQDISALAQAIRVHRRSHPDHAIIAVLHWGTEFQSSPSASQRRAAAALANAGTDALIGHHPHVTQPVETLSLSASEERVVPVFYSLGNFVFDQTPPQTRQAIMAEIVITDNAGRPRLAARSVPVTLRHCAPHL